MCGICGIILKNPIDRGDFDFVYTMMNELTNRGPDDSGIYRFGQVGFGFRRLSIIDLFTGHQPLCNEDNKVWITFNGEIYNYRHLKSLLIQKGHSFKTDTDTEVIVHLYEEFGENCVDHLEGMFAFVIHDQRSNKIFGARDRFGKKPFYYSFSPDGFYFGSEIKALKAINSIDKGMNSQALDDYFAYGYTSGEETVYKGIRRLLPAHRFTLDLSCFGFRIDRYWSLSAAKSYKLNENEWVEQLDHLFTKAVEKRLISDVPLGAFLSGGLDSSAVVWKMSMLLQEPVKTFSIGFTEPEYDETEFANVVSDKFRTDHRAHYMGFDSLPPLAEIVRVYDEPFADSSAIPTLFLSEFARKHVTVALSGDGGDEVFAGYSSYWRLNNIFRTKRKIDFSQLFKLIYAFYPSNFRGKATINYLAQSRSDMIFHQTLWSRDQRSKMFLSKINEDQTAESRKQQRLLSNFTGSFITDMQLNDVYSYMTDDVLCKVDRASMAKSLEVRSPLLDHNLVEFAFTMPEELKLGHSNGKYIFRKYLNSHLPPEITRPRKKGFGIPLSVWFKGSLVDYVNKELLQNNSPQLFEIINEKYVRNFIAGISDNYRQVGTQVWSLLVFNEWLKQNDFQ